MNVHTGKFVWSRLAGLGMVGLISAGASAQSLDDSIQAISGSASVFAGVAHSRADGANGANSTTEPSIGVSGSVGGGMRSGANALDLRYSGTLEMERDLANGGQSDSSSLVGATRFNHWDPASPFDFNLGHTVNSVRNDTGFVANPSEYDTRHSLSGGAGLRVYRGELTELRISGQAGRSYGEGDVGGDSSYTGSATLSRRLSERSSASLVGSRSISDESDTDTTIDSLQLSYNRVLETGSFGIGVGVSQAETEYNDGTASDYEAGTGFITRSWMTPDSQTIVEYNRRLTDSTIDLSLDVPEFLSFLPDSVRLTELVLTDSLSVAHNTTRLCDVCTLGFVIEGSVLESQLSETRRHEYRTSANLGVELTSLQTLTIGYTWQGDAGEDAGTIEEQVHRINTRWTRELAENTSFSVDFTQSYLRSRVPGDDEEEFLLRLMFSHGFSLTNVGG
ncbi:hypothetical protein [Marinobacter oulmenensis]|uniref:TIGR03016 family PEP-CTERM system-associated outer membrane protein n=1 Tax=Marinobacter oulmenensis TaxID=643747 RepID=A0A840U6F6_9GAMM|nr:hypothetical protein [Marinobacter oulmenensis]MBB5320709.1 hypothetical protein [Marinobacter oulmenensis]